MDVDYRALGLKCGLECHQQLDTGKLFSRAPSVLRDDEPNFTVERRLRPTVSELGELDRAALEAYEKNLSYVYEGYSDTTSLLELDEEPPQPIDQEALATTLEVALMCKSTVLDEMFVMRKMVIDGSNTSGFQRTVLVATGGSVKLSTKELGIETIVLEEDSARPTKKTEGKIHYRLDRLGIPLIELATEPGTETPEEAKEAARAIGNLFRRTGKVKRGLGTIRQDLNVSIRGGGRVEIKGVQELEIIDEYVRREVQRQLGLIEIKKELGHRGVGESEFMAEPVEVTGIFSATNSNILKGALSKGEKIVALKLAKFKGLIGKELQPNRRLGTEFADHVKSKAGLRGIFHSDELPSHGITQEEVDALSSKIGCTEKDAFVLFACPPEKAGKATKAVLERALQCLKGVPEETRGAIDAGNTEYLRHLPGSARMYPETDLESILVDGKVLSEIKKNLPMGIGERKKLYSKWGLAERHVSEMGTSNYARLFERAVKKGADARKTAVFLLEGLVEARRDGALVENLDEESLLELIECITHGKVTKEIQFEVIVEKTRKPGTSVDAILAGLGAKSMGKAEAEKIVSEIVRRNARIVKEQGEKALSPLMGDAMKELKGKVSGKVVSELILREMRKLSASNA